MSSNNLVKKTKKKFLLFSILGMAIIFVMSAITYRYHKNVVREQKQIQDLYHVLNKQLSLIHRIAIKADELNQIQDEKFEIDLKAELNELSEKLSQSQKMIESYTVMKGKNSKKSSSSEIKNFDQKIELRIDRYVNLVNSLIKTPTSNIFQKRNIITQIDKKATGALTTNLERVFEDVEIRNNKSLDSLNKIAILLILLCTGEVFFIWVFVFNPLYKAIILQNENINQSRLSAESANRAKTHFLANISHEIRTPMTAILGYAEILNKEKNNLSNESLNAIETINKSSTHLLALIDDILNVSKIEAGKVEPIIIEVNIQKVLNEIYSLLDVKAKEKGIKFKFTVKGEIPPNIFTDEKLLKQILFNIIGNAIKFTDQGFVEVQCSYNFNQNQFKFLVKDSGVGISKKGQKFLFKPFFQGDTSHQRKYGGTGLGLVLSKGIAETLGGTLTLLRSEENVGSQFLVTIDSGNIKTNDFIDKLNIEKNTIQEQDLQIPLENHLLGDHQILVVDDAKENARLFKVYLEGAHAQVDLAYDGDEALKLARKKKYDIILLDIQMPGKDGFQVIKELRKNGFNGPIKALTAHAMPEEKTRTLKAGFNGHIIKPVDAETLIRECYTKLL